MGLRLLSIFLAEEEGFEPSVMLPLRLISSQVHSTTLPPLRFLLRFVEAYILAGELMSIGQISDECL